MTPRPVTAYPGTVVHARIDAAAITHNVQLIAERIRPASLMCIVKADAYGHGLDTVVRACRAAGIRDFGVATVPEAQQLADLLGSDPEVRRERILCWLYDDRTDLSACVVAGVELGVSTPVAFAQAVSAARDTGLPVRIHLKVDTGLGRNGFTPAALAGFLPQLVTIAAQAPDTVEVVGVMTHLANADDPGDPATSRQLAEFDAALTQVQAAMEDAGGAIGDPAALIAHAANSPAALSLTPVPGQLARVGLSIYGLSPFADRSAADLGLRPAMTVVSRVLTVKDVPAGHGASYGLTYRCAADTRFALVAGGYADGIPRAASDRAEVAVGGRRYPVVGRIAMDQMILDIGDADVQIGDEAILLGDGITGPSAEEWARWSGSVNYEVVTRIGPRVERVPVSGADVPGSDVDTPDITAPESGADVPGSRSRR